MFYAVQRCSQIAFLLLVVFPNAENSGQFLSWWVLLPFTWVTNDSSWGGRGALCKKKLINFRGFNLFSFVPNYKTKILREPEHVPPVIEREARIWLIDITFHYMVLKSINIRLPSCSEKRPDLLKNLIWRVCISIGCEFAYFNNNLPSFCLICAQLAIQITLSWIDYHRFNKPFIICRYNNGTSLDKEGIKVLFLEIGVAQLVINFIPLYIPVLNTDWRRVFPLFTFKMDQLFRAPVNSYLPVAAVQMWELKQPRLLRMLSPAVATAWNTRRSQHSSPRLSLSHVQGDQCQDAS